MQRVVRPLRRVPSQVWIACVIGAIFVIGFFAAVVPLLVSGGHNPTAELTGRFPDSIPKGQDFVLPLAFDNTSSSIVSPLCLSATVAPSGGLRATQAIFQGLETAQFHNGRACGGSLSGGEVINIRLTLSPTTRGRVSITLTPEQGGRAIGPPLRGTLDVSG